MTAQSCDEVRYGLESWIIFGDALEPYFKAHPKRTPRTDIRSTSLYRGYLASWTIRADRLWLTGLFVLGGARTDGIRFKACSLPATFPGRPKPVLANWFSGPLILAGGELVEHVHAGFGSVYSRYRLLILRRGVIVGRICLTMEEYGRRRLEQRDVTDWRNEVPWEVCRVVPTAYAAMRDVDWSDLSRGRVHHSRPTRRAPSPARGA